MKRYSSSFSLSEKARPSRTIMASSSLVSFPCLSSLKTTFKPMAALSKSSRKYELKKGQNRLYHKLQSGLKMEVIEQRKQEDEKEEARKRTHHWFLYMEATTQLGAGLSIGYLSSLLLGLILMPSAY